MKSIQMAYLIQCEAQGWPIKIGCTKDVISRIVNIKAHNPFPLRLLAIIGDGQATEREMKRLFAPHVLSGEWYKPVAEIFDFITACRAAGRCYEQRITNKEYVREVLRPIVLEHLDGCEPPTDKYDPFAQVLRGVSLRDGHRLRDDLPRLTKGRVTQNLTYGYFPLTSAA